MSGPGDVSDGFSDDLRELTELMHGARALAHRVWDAGWRPTRRANGRSEPEADQ